MSFTAVSRRLILRGHSGHHLRSSASTSGGLIAVCHQQQRIISRNHAYSSCLAATSSAIASSSPSPSNSLLLHHGRNQHQHKRCQPSLSFSNGMSTMANKNDESSSSNQHQQDEAPPTFSSIPTLHPSSLHAIEHKMKLSNMTEIQHKTFEAASSGRDILGMFDTNKCC